MGNVLCDLIFIVLILHTISWYPKNIMRTTHARIYFKFNFYENIDLTFVSWIIFHYIILSRARYHLLVNYFAVMKHLLWTCVMKHNRTFCLYKALKLFFISRWASPYLHKFCWTGTSNKLCAKGRVNWIYILKRALSVYDRQILCSFPSFYREESNKRLFLLNAAESVGEQKDL